MGRTKHFPPPNTTPIYCDEERVKDLYNSMSGAKKAAESVSATVRKWFAAQAVEEGWTGVKFAKYYGTTSSAGCVLYLEPKPTAEASKLREVLGIKVMFIYPDTK